RSSPKLRERTVKAGRGAVGSWNKGMEVLLGVVHDCRSGTYSHAGVLYWDGHRHIDFIREPESDIGGVLVNLQIHCRVGLDHVSHETTLRRIVPSDGTCSPKNVVAVVLMRKDNRQSSHFRSINGAEFEKLIRHP